MTDGRPGYDAAAALLDRMVRAVVDEVDPERVVLFGSRAGCGVSKDVLVYSRDEVEYWRDSLDNVLAQALREGRTLYERP